MQSTTSAGRKKRSPRTLEPEPESLDKNIPTDNTPEMDNTADLNTLQHYDGHMTDDDKKMSHFQNDYLTQQLQVDYFKNPELLDGLPQGPTRAL